nr:MAG TPA: transposase-like protein [Caudoviricetes sp.]
MCPYGSSETSSCYGYITAKVYECCSCSKQLSHFTHINLSAEYIDLHS